MQKILVIDDDRNICELLNRFLENKGYQTDYRHNVADAVKALKETPYDCVISDYRLPDENGVTMLKKTKILRPEAAFIIITGYSDVKTAVKTIKMGAFEYITKPLHPDELLETIKRALATEATTDSSSEDPKPKKAPRANAGPDFIHGVSPQAKNVLKHIKLVAPTEMTVIIIGETGTGKEYIARTIHQKSARQGSPFQAVDCGALTNELAGSELFGHEKGAFTGAVTAKPGSFELANGGTLFLDEIGNLSYDIQVKMLRVIQERQITRIGGTKPKKVNVRIVVATNDNLREMVKDGKFREDLYHRLNEFSIYMPPLRERKEDVMLFANFFLSAANSALGKEVNGFDTEVQEIFSTYPWHGNLRELRNVIKRAVLLTSNSVIEKQALPHEIAYHTHKKFGEVDSSHLNDKHDGGLKSTAGQAERQAILEALQETGNNKTKAAQLLQIDRKTLYNKLKEYDISL